MKPKLTTTSIASHSFFLLSYLALGIPNATAGELAQSPLFLQTSVSPNIFFLTDDSGSMLSDLMTQDNSAIGQEGAGAQLRASTSDASASELLAQINTPDDFVHNLSCTRTRRNIDDTLYLHILEEGFATPCTTVAEEEWRARFYQYNTLYYNPNRTYRPWPGLDENGAPLYLRSDIESAPVNPNEPDGTKLNLLTDSAVLGDDGHNYHQTSTAWASWCDDRNINLGNCNGWRYYELQNGELQIRWVKDLNAEEKINFANWFSYHRTREHVAKFATGGTILQIENAQVGYGVLNENNTTSNAVAIAPLTSEHSSILLNKIYHTSSFRGTPLRNRLKAVGEYYKTGNFFGTTLVSPIFTEANGGICQSNNTILVTDGYYADLRSDSPDVGNVDSDNGAPYADTWPNTLADVAMYYYENDLSSIPDTPDIQRMRTYTVSFGVTGTIDPDTDDIYADGFSWPDPSTDDAHRIDDLYHAAVNSRGNYLSAQDPEALSTALANTVRNITNQTQSANSVASSGARLQEGSKVFISELSSGNWTGKLLGYSINADGDISENPVWNAATELDLYGHPTILTSSASQGISFEWDDISAAQQIALINGHADGSDIGEARLDYLRGDNYDVDYSFRARETLLGDIVNSGPVYVGAPAMLLPDTAPYGASSERYSSFKNNSTYKNRTPVVYVGANDGMLHGFRADNGREILAYVPETVFPNLHKLTSNDYEHQYYVDLTPTVSDAYFAKSGRGNADWRTVLIGGLGAGGRGLFALDISNPSNFTDSNTNASNTVLWEFNNNNDPDFGYSLSQPVVALTKENRWAVIVGNGYNSDSGRAKLFILYLDADLSDGRWDEGSDYLKIDTEIGRSSDKNGLFSPATVDTDGDGYVDRIYAGDLKGNLWSFDLSDNNDTNWDSAYFDSSSNPQPLFTAYNASNQFQAITTKPEIIRHPFQPTIPADKPNPTTPNLMIFFGTGQYLTTDDIVNTNTQSFYGIWDIGTANDQDNNQLDRDNLIMQTVTSGIDSDNNIDARITGNTPVPYYDTSNTRRFGWLLDLDSATAATGERVIARAIIINNIVFFNTYIPNSATCESGGESWFMFVKAVNGGIPPEPIININNDNAIDDNDMVSLPNESTSAPSGLKTAGTFGSPLFDLGVGDRTGSVINNTSDGMEKRDAMISPEALGKRISWSELRLE